MAVVYLVGIVATFLYSRLMVTVSQGILQQIRDDMFAHMQTLPIKYFDTHPFGDIMSRYTNDSDTLRQMLSMSVPQAFASIIAIIAVTVAMLIINIPLTLLVFLCVLAMMFAMKTIGGRSAKHFIKQQTYIGDLNGFIEEMINGQKVVKVFCHERQTKEAFDKKNEALAQQAASANMYANIIMPIIGNIGNLQYALIALAGGAFALSGFGGVTLGAIAAFLSLSRSFSQPIGQISMQMNSVIMALAGAERIFNLLDEQCETDDGYVALVNAQMKNGKLTECQERTHCWAWKHPHTDGSTTYTKLEGAVELLDVDFGYTETKLVLKNISLYAKPGQKIAFVGATGAGKTTIFYMIVGFYRPTAGIVSMDDIDITLKPMYRRARQGIAYLPQEASIFRKLTVEQNIWAILESRRDINTNQKKERLEALLDEFGIGRIRGQLGYTLSGGERRRTEIARALATEPKFLLLDEPFAGIDPIAVYEIKQIIRRLAVKGIGILITDHNVRDTLEITTEAFIIADGNIVARGDRDVILANEMVREVYLGAEFRM
jgi:ATP-binding cassette subfamily B protein